MARGYGATSLQEIAETAGVAVQTIYFGFGCQAWRARRRHSRGRCRRAVRPTQP
ncbi:TetR family transcriptional regulator [Kribbella deserti]|uniref:TetR family transcriptional regulator n=1 Tax=Kribbella deserti TaxID=1926257 RepID=A0ABV6QTC6_9ACTN